jgi:hypothetical protein
LEAKAKRAEDKTKAEATKQAKAREKAEARAQAKEAVAEAKEKAQADKRAKVQAQREARKALAEAQAKEKKLTGSTRKASNKVTSSRKGTGNPDAAIGAALSSPQPVPSPKALSMPGVAGIINDDTGNICLLCVWPP